MTEMCVAVNDTYHMLLLLMFSFYLLQFSGVRDVFLYPKLVQKRGEDY